jgi:DNA-binding NtrC family response regulator
VASADSSFRQKLCTVLSGLRWNVREAHGGAQAWGEAMDVLPQTIIVDSWLPDLDVNEFLREFRVSFPNVDVVTNGSASSLESAPGPFRQEILYALRHVQDGDTAAWNAAPVLGEAGQHSSRLSASCESLSSEARVEETGSAQVHDKPKSATEAMSGLPSILEPPPASQVAENRTRSDAAGRSLPSGAWGDRIPELIGDSQCMLEISRRIRRVAARNTPVLIEGPTG